MRKSIKEIILSLVFVLAGFFSWYFLYLFFYNGFVNLRSLLLAAIFLILFGATYSIFLFLVKPKKFIFLGFVLVSIFPIFIFGNNLYLLIGIALFFILLFFGFLLLKRERDLFSLKLRPMWIFRRGLGYFFLGLSLMLALIFYVSPLSEFKMEIPRFWFDGIFDKLQPLISSQLPGFDQEMTADEFLTAQYLFLSKVQPKGQKIPESADFFEFLRNPAFAESLKIAQNSNQKYLENLIVRNKKVLEENKKEFSKILGVGIEGEEKMKDILYYWVNNKVLTISKPYQEYISLGFVLAVFLALQALNLPYKWFVGFFGWFLFKLLVLAGVVKIQKEMVEKETATL